MARRDHQPRDLPHHRSARGPRPPFAVASWCSPPMDTVYGIGADAFTSEAVASDLPRRGGCNTPTVLIGSPNTLHGLVTDFSEMAWSSSTRSAGAHPRRQAPAVPAVGLGRHPGTVAIRMPLHPVAIELLTEVGPMAVSSANLTGHPAPEATVTPRRRCSATPSPCTSTAGHLNVPSSIVDVTWQGAGLLRAGAWSAEELRKVVPDLEVAN